MNRTQQQKILDELLRQRSQHRAEQQQTLNAQFETDRVAEMRQTAIDEENHRRKIIVIAGVDLDGGFAKNHKTPWQYKDDLKWFKNRTKGQICVMGRHTYEEILERKLSYKPRATTEVCEPSVLPGRTCFVVSNTLTELPNATVVKGIAEVELHLAEDDQRTLFVIGGERLFREALPLAEQVYLTVINKSHACDMFFPTEYLEKHFVMAQMMKSNKESELRFLVWTRSFSDSQALGDSGIQYNSDDDTATIII